MHSQTMSMKVYLVTQKRIVMTYLKLSYHNVSIRDGALNRLSVSIMELYREGDSHSGDGTHPY